MSGTAYRVNVVREDDAWIATAVDVPGAHTYARNLSALLGNVREVIALVLDIEDESGIEVEFEFEGVEPEVEAAAAVGRTRRELDALQRTLAADTERLAVELAGRSWSVRDIAGLLAVSPGRVSQIVGEQGERKGRAAPVTGRYQSKRGSAPRVSQRDASTGQLLSKAAKALSVTAKADAKAAKSDAKAARALKPGSRTRVRKSV